MVNALSVKDSKVYMCMKAERLVMALIQNEVQSSIFPVQMKWS